MSLAKSKKLFKSKAIHRYKRFTKKSIYSIASHQQQRSRPPSASTGAAPASFQERVLRNVLPIVLGFLNARDLGRAARVCHFWEEEVRATLSSRGFQGRRIPLCYDYKPSLLATPRCQTPASSSSKFIEPYLETSERALDSSRTADTVFVLHHLAAKPKLSLIFVSDTLGSGFKLTDVLFRYRGYVPVGGVAMIECSALTIDSQELEARRNLGFGLFLSSGKLIRTKYCGASMYDIERWARLDFPTDIPNSIIEDLDIRDPNDRACFLLFNVQVGYRYYPRFSATEKQTAARFIATLVKNLRERCNPSSYSLWGGTIVDLAVSTNIFGETPCLLGIKLHGPTLFSWSIAVGEHLSSSERARKLRDFKGSVNLRSKVLAMAMVPVSSEVEGHKQRLAKTAEFKEVFPSLSLLCLYTLQDPIQFNVDGIQTDQRPDLERKHSITYLIITYGYKKSNSTSS